MIWPTVTWKLVLTVNGSWWSFEIQITLICLINTSSIIGWWSPYLHESCCGSSRVIWFPMDLISRPLDSSLGLAVHWLFMPMGTVNMDISQVIFINNLVDYFWLQPVKVEDKLWFSPSGCSESHQGICLMHGRSSTPSDWLILQSEQFSYSFSKFLTAINGRFVPSC